MALPIPLRKVSMEKGEERMFYQKNSFFKQGKHLDEITIRFTKDEDGELYVSKAFLGHVSPVFHSMFMKDLKENGKMDIKDFKRTDFHEFLLCCYPGTMKDVTKDNVFPVVAIAHKYEAKPLEGKCMKVMESWLTECSIGENAEFNISHASKIKICLQILQIANRLGVTNLTSIAIDRVCQFCSGIYLIADFQTLLTGRYKPQPPAETPHMFTQRPGSYSPPPRPPPPRFEEELAIERPRIEFPEFAECFTLFQNLPAKLREMVTNQRLKLIDQVGK